MKLKKLGRGLADILSVSKKPAPSVPPSRPVDERVIPPKAVERELPPPVLVKEVTEGKNSTSQGTVWVATERIIPNRFQPRKEFDPATLKELADSIRTSGVIQPILVRASGQQYELIAGERRWRACRQLNLAKVPAIIKEADDRTLLEWAIIENTQRQDLNPIERARAYKQLVEVFHLTHEAVAERMGIERSSATNFIRLLELPLEVQEEVSRGTISMGHARSLLSVSDKETLLKLTKRIKREGMSVRRLEYIIRYLKRKSKTPRPGGGNENLYLKELEDRLRRKFGTKVSITSYKSKGYITMDFYSNEDFQRILELLEK